MEHLKFAMAELNLIARTYDRILKVARTTAEAVSSQSIIGGHHSDTKGVSLQALPRAMPFQDGLSGRRDYLSKVDFENIPEPKQCIECGIPGTFFQSAYKRLTEPGFFGKRIA